MDHTVVNRTKYHEVIRHSITPCFPLGETVQRCRMLHVERRCMSWAAETIGRRPKGVKRIYDFEYLAESWDKPRRVVAKVEWHPGELFPRVSFVVTNLPMEPHWIIKLYNQRGTAERHIQEAKQAINWTRLSCRGMAQNECAFNFMRWPTILASSCKALINPRR